MSSSNTKPYTPPHKRNGGHRKRNRASASNKWRESSPSSEESLNSSSSGSSRGSSPLSSVNSSPPKGSASNNWRARSGARSPSPVCSSILLKDSRPDFGNLRPGTVLTLSPEVEVQDPFFNYRMQPRQDCLYNHPVVVLKKHNSYFDDQNMFRRTEVVECRLLTSFGGIGLKAKKDHEQRKIALCDNNAGAKAHGTTRMLTFEPGSDKFEKATFINFHEGVLGPEDFLIEYSSLKSWDTTNGRPITFDEKSVKRILTKQVC